MVRGPTNKHCTLPQNLAKVPEGILQHRELPKWGERGHQRGSVVQGAPQGRAHAKKITGKEFNHHLHKSLSHHSGPRVNYLHKSISYKPFLRVTICMRVSTIIQISGR